MSTPPPSHKSFGELLREKKQATAPADTVILVTGTRSTDEVHPPTAPARDRENDLAMRRAFEQRVKGLRANDLSDAVTAVEAVENVPIKRALRAIISVIVRMRENEVRAWRNYSAHVERKHKLDKKR